MSDHPRIGERRGRTVEVDLAHWPGVDHDALPEYRRAQCLRRRKAVEMYLSGASEAALKEATGNPRSNAYRIIVDRCLSQHPDGTLIGWRGALPFFRLASYRRKAAPKVRADGRVGAVGALRWLFESAGGADIESRFRKQIVGKVPNLAAAKRPKRELFAWFIKELRAAGFEARGEWPFNVEKLGYVKRIGVAWRVVRCGPDQALNLVAGQHHF